METIPDKKLRNNVGEVLRRAEDGEEFTVTVSGRPVARLGPARTRRSVGEEALRRIWQTPAPESLAEDLEMFPGEPTDPSA